MPQLIWAAVLAASTAAANHPAADVVDSWQAALKDGRREAVLEMLAPDAIVYESGGAENSRDEYASHHLDADIGFARATKTTTEGRSDRPGRCGGRAEPHRDIRDLRGETRFDQGRVNDGPPQGRGWLAHRAYPLVVPSRAVTGARFVGGRRRRAKAYRRCCTIIGTDRGGDQRSPVPGRAHGAASIGGPEG